MVPFALFDIGWADVAAGLAPTLVVFALGALAFVAKWLSQVKSDTGAIKQHLNMLNGTVATLKESDSEQNQRIAYLEGQSGMALGSVKAATGKATG